MGLPATVIVTAFDVNGNPLTGLNPVFLAYCDETGNNIAAPTIFEIKDGAYYFTPVSRPGFRVYYLIDLGATAFPRYASDLMVPDSASFAIGFTLYDSSFTPEAGLAPTFSAYCDETGLDIVAPAIIPIKNGGYYFVPNFRTGHDLYYQVDGTVNAFPRYLSDFVHREEQPTPTPVIPPAVLPGSTSGASLLPTLTYPDGVDYSVFTTAGPADLDPNWIPISGVRSRAEAILKRWIAYPGEMHDPNYGVGILRYLNSTLGDTEQRALQALLKQQAQQVDGVDQVNVQLQNDGKGTLTLKGNFTLVIGGTYKFVFVLSSTSIQIITLLGPNNNS